MYMRRQPSGNLRIPARPTNDTIRAPLPVHNDCLAEADDVFMLPALYSDLSPAQDLAAFAELGGHFRAMARKAWCKVIVLLRNTKKDSTL